MGQKVNAHGLRVGVIKDWDSRWYTPDAELGDTLVSDYNLRNYLKKKLQAAAILSARWSKPISPPVNTAAGWKHVFRPNRTAICTSVTSRRSVWTSASPKNSAASATCVWTIPTRPKKKSNMLKVFRKISNGWVLTGKNTCTLPAITLTGCMTARSN